MSTTVERRFPEVPPEEVARLIAEWRRVAAEHRSPAIVVYHPPHHPCPWPGCEYRIAAIEFHLERMYGPAECDHAVVAWWQGPGLVARCPGCQRYVLFGLQDKHAVPNPESVNALILPDDWNQKSHLRLRPAD